MARKTLLHPADSRAVLVKKSFRISPSPTLTVLSGDSAVLYVTTPTHAPIPCYRSVTYNEFGRGEFTIRCQDGSEVSLSGEDGKMIRKKSRGGKVETWPSS